MDTNDILKKTGLKIFLFRITKSKVVPFVSSCKFFIIIFLIPILSLQLNLPSQFHNSARRDSKIIHGAFGISG